MTEETEKEYDENEMRMMKKNEEEWLFQTPLNDDMGKNKAN